MANVSRILPAGFEFDTCEVEERQCSKTAKYGQREVVEEGAMKLNLLAYKQKAIRRKTNTAYYKQIMPTVKHSGGCRIQWRLKGNPGRQYIRDFQRLETYGEIHPPAGQQ